MSEKCRCYGCFTEYPCPKDRLKDERDALKARVAELEIKVEDAYLEGAEDAFEAATGMADEYEITALWLKSLTYAALKEERNENER